MEKVEHDHGGHPSMRFQDPAGRDVTFAFGYMNNEPTIAVFADGDEVTFLLPREIIEYALSAGWGAEGCPGCESETKEDE